MLSTPRARFITMAPLQNQTPKKEILICTTIISSIRKMWKIKSMVIRRILSFWMRKCLSSSSMKELNRTMVFCKSLLIRTLSITSSTELTGAQNSASSKKGPTSSWSIIKRLTHMSEVVLTKVPKSFLRVKLSEVNIWLRKCRNRQIVWPTIFQIWHMN